MGSSWMLKVRVCLQPFFNQERPAFLTVKTCLWQPPQLASSARFLCSRDTNQDLGGRQTEKRSNPKSAGPGATRQARTGLWDEAVDGRNKRSALKPRPSFPKSVFAAGTAKKTAEIMKMKASLGSGNMELHEEEPEQRRTRGRLEAPDRPLSLAEWRKLKESLGNQERFDIRMMGVLFSSGSDLDIAKSLLTFVASESGTLSYEVLLRYLTLCVSGGHDEEVADVYDIMRGSFPSLETGASSLFIKSFSRTGRWREAVSILQEVKKVFTPSPRNYGDIIAAAVLSGDSSSAWALYDELMEKGLSPPPETWEALFRAARKTREDEEGEETKRRLLGILQHMRDNQIYPSHSMASSIKTWFESLSGQKWTGSWTSISPKGVCNSCGSELESIQLTEEEYQQLKGRVMADIIQGKDVFNKTTPEELERFKAFVRRKPAFDVVVDGLNVANIYKDKSRQSQTLLAVVSELHRQGLEVLVLGRKHMLRASRSWDRLDMGLVREKAHCFFTDNISEDDPFLLYAALHSGNRCRFVSRDLMRDHRACLPEGGARRLFFKWQRGHQLVVGGAVAPGRRVRFQSVQSYDTIVQSSGDSWHLPYDDSPDRSSYEVPNSWICLRKIPTD
ncbi:mitochondrial ribonuclease P catalytic subunit [Menidia menidia]